MVVVDGDNINRVYPRQIVHSLSGSVVNRIIGELSTDRGCDCLVGLRRWSIMAWKSV